jgi:hypothetical protein
MSPPEKKPNLLQDWDGKPRTRHSEEEMSGERREMSEYPAGKKAHG